MRRGVAAGAPRRPDDTCGAARCRPRRSSSTPAVSGFYRVVLRRRAAQPPHRRDAGDARHVRALQPRRRRVERGRRRPARRRRLPHVRRGLRRRPRPRRVAGDRCSACAGSDARSTTTDYPRFQERVAALLRPVVADLGEPTEDEDDLRGKLRGLRHRRARRARPRRRHQSRCVASSTTPAAAVSASTPSSSPPRRPSSRQRVAPTTSSGSSTASARPPLRRSSCATCTRSPSSTTKRCCCARASSCLTDEVKTQNAPFVLRSAIANRRHGGAAWRFVRQHWTEANAAFPQNTIVRMVVDGVDAHRPRPRSPTCKASSPSTRSRRGPRRSTRSLERQRVNAALRQRERVVLAAAL